MGKNVLVGAFTRACLSPIAVDPLIDDAGWEAPLLIDDADWEAPPLIDDAGWQAPLLIEDASWETLLLNGDAGWEAPLLIGDVSWEAPPLIGDASRELLSLNGWKACSAITVVVNSAMISSAWFLTVSYVRPSLNVAM